MTSFHLYLKSNISGVFFDASQRQESGTISIALPKSLERKDRRPPIDDFIILAQPGEQPQILPYLFKVDNYISKNGQVNLRLKIDQIYSSSLLPAKILQIPDLSLGIREDKIIRLEANLYYQIIGFLSRISVEISQDLASPTSSTAIKVSEVISEIDMLTRIKNHIVQRGYYFPEEIIDSFHVSLKTRPFVILAGFSGMGKSKLPQLYAEALGYERNFLLLPVKPDWSNEQHILGFIDSINYIYVQEPLTEFLLRAIDHKDELFFVCLDEMNLSRVEEYFASFLSVMEQDDPEKWKINLYSKSTKEWLKIKNGPDKEIMGLPPSPLLIPSNIFFVGTINGGINTYALSDKVLDRANCLEFHQAKFTEIPEQRMRNGGKQPPIPASVWQSYKVKSPNEEYYAKLEEIGEILYKAMVGVSYRIARQIGLYIANGEKVFKSPNGEKTSDMAFDLQVKQRILPLVRGPQVNKKLIENLKDFFTENNLVRSAAYLDIIRKTILGDYYGEEE